MASIELPSGETVLVDDRDLPLLQGYAWCITGPGYVGTKIAADGRKVSLYLHRLIMENVLQPGQHVDHVNGDRLDNRRANLRPATPGQNMANSGSKIGSSSQYKGVSFRKDTGKYRASIQVNGATNHLGTFENEDDAARAYDAAALQTWGEFAKVNLPAVSV
jgi:hypothetical protein